MTDAAGHTSELSPCVAVGNGGDACRPRRTRSPRRPAARRSASSARSPRARQRARRHRGGRKRDRRRGLQRGSAGRRSSTPGRRRGPRRSRSSTTRSSRGRRPINVKLTNPSAGLAVGTPPLRDARGRDDHERRRRPAPAPATTATATTTAAATGPRPRQATGRPVRPRRLPRRRPAGPTRTSTGSRAAIKSSRLKRLTGTASDPDGDLARVEVALVSARGQRTACTSGEPGRVIRRSGRCAPRTWLRAERHHPLGTAPAAATAAPDVEDLRPRHRRPRPARGVLQHRRPQPRRGSHQARLKPVAQPAPGGP